jgi:para-nitrobenzyl esterase
VSVVRVTGGDVRGEVVDGVLTVKGVPYGRAERFGRPLPAEPWAGIRSSLFYGPIAPQSPSTEGMIGNGHDEDNHLLARGSAGCVQAEDCLRVNVWTPGAAGSRPVMVYLHGGGFVGGSGNDLRAYDGAELARRQDVVVVTANHRLGLLGFLDVRALGAPADHANLGLQDLVLLLEWVRDNAAAFGGDPAQVTVFGQSGGAVKVAALLEMPAAAGLFHRAIMQSGVAELIHSPEDAARQTREVVAELGLATLDELRGVPLGRLVDVTRSIGIGWRPVVDGTVLAGYPLGHPAATGSRSPQVPVLVGSNLAEFVHGIDAPEADDFGEAELAAGHAPELVAAYRRDHPDLDPFALHCGIEALWMRAGVERTAASARAGGGSAWRYLFAFAAPVIAPRVGVYHSAEIAYVFANAHRCREQTGGGPDAIAVADAMSGAWARFARSGDPGWDRGMTMVFDARSEERRDLDVDALALAEA